MQGLRIAPACDLALVMVLRAKRHWNQIGMKIASEDGLGGGLAPRPKL
jgi:hypothetical protein